MMGLWHQVMGHGLDHVLGGVYLFLIFLGAVMGQKKTKRRRTRR